MALPLALPASSLLAGCGKVTPEQIEHWKETQKGPSRLREVVADDGQPPAMRGQAVSALVDLGMAADVEADLKGAPEAGRQATVHEAVPALVAAAEGKCG